MKQDIWNYIARKIHKSLNVSCFFYAFPIKSLTTWWRLQYFSWLGLKKVSSRASTCNKRKCEWGKTFFWAQSLKWNRLFYSWWKLTRETAPGAVDVSERLLLGDCPLDLLQDQVQLFGAPQVLLLGRVEALPQRQELPLVDINHISCIRRGEEGTRLLHVFRWTHVIKKRKKVPQTAKARIHLMPFFEKTINCSKSSLSLSVQTRTIDVVKRWHVDIRDQHLKLNIWPNTVTNNHQHPGPKK